MPDEGNTLGYIVITFLSNFLSSSCNNLHNLLTPSPQDGYQCLFVSFDSWHALPLLFLQRGYHPLIILLVLS